ncbi:hypothetical protein DEDE109153_10480 [Deinococcus deserti]|uniref:DUF3108 domain-containing protein n=1 Tax=Deinococcus deserti (strain DSM 17065 / CIP 109153 / LMG 22923 / VCD115) TaxID=546414 RepID=C1CZC3_DEIDV|nr:hypothetical protein [Deinococcus deserti]ACO45161.1 Conserved hypothetical protein, precursor [Deinococcus deserti VCD115]
MHKPILLTVTLLLSTSALAWVPQLEQTTARNVIDSAYGRRDPVNTFLTLDLGVREGQFVAGKEAVKVFDGEASCVADWLAAPQDFSKGSRPVAVTASGQADQLAFQATEARDRFRNLSVTDALGAELAGARLPDGQLRVDVSVRGLPTEKARGAYLARLKGLEGKLISPVRSSYVNDFKEEAGKWSGTLVFYFEPLKAGLGASDKIELLLRTEADTNCAYSVTLDLASFQ